MLMPFAIAAAPPNTSEIFAMSVLNYLAASAGSSIFRTSTRFPLRNFFLGPERRDTGTLGDRLNIPLDKTFRRERNRPVRFYQEQRRHMRDPERIADRISFALAIEQRRHAHTVGLLKTRRAGILVLGNRDHLQGALRNPVEEGKRHLAYRATDLIQRQQRRPAREHAGESLLPTGQIVQCERGRLRSGLQHRSFILPLDAAGRRSECRNA